MKQPGVFNLMFYRGDTYRWTCLLYKDELGTVPADVRDHVIKAEIRESTAGSLVTSLNVTTFPASEPHRIDLLMTPEMYETCPATGVWDLQLTNLAGDVRTILKGSVTVIADVTESELSPSPNATARRVS